MAEKNLIKEEKEHKTNQEEKLVRVLLTLNRRGHIVNVEPVGNILKDHVTGSENCQCKGQIEYVTSAAILCKANPGPCCIRCGDDMWCWC